MRRRSVLLRLLAGLVLATLGSRATAQAPDVPLGVLRNWMWYNETGWADLDRGNYARAEEKFHLAIKELKPYSPANRKLMARTYCDLARVLYYEKRYAEAEPLAKWALSVRDADKKATSDNVFQSLFTLAMIQSAQKHYADAEPLLVRALAIQEKELVPGHVNTLITLDRLGEAYREQGKFLKAEPIYRRTIAILERNNPGENLDLADMAEQYAILLRKMKRIDQAEKWQARAVAIRDTVASKDARARADQFERNLQGFK
jgi:tetratricopeptide (TPR) repeat protein